MMINPSGLVKPLRQTMPMLMLMMIALLSGCEMADQPATAEDIALGKRIYMEGILVSGEPLQGKRMQTVSVDGASAACQSCHRASGMGSLEGNIVAPPIGSRFLFANKEDQPLAIVDIRQASNIIRAHAPYDEKSFIAAVSEGININGQQMNPLMPHYDLSKADVKALMAYLKQLSAELSPGVTADSVEFAAIVAPDVASEERGAMVKMIQTIFRARNTSQQSHSGQMKMPMDLVPRTPRKWNLSLWELKGHPDTWAEQLHAFYDAKPVFAVVAGISKSTWDPINAFCLHKQLPCMLPNTAVVPDQPGFYNMYYSHGVSLEAQVLAQHIRTVHEQQNVHRLIQVYRKDDAGVVATNALEQSLKGGGVQIQNRELTGLEPAQIQALFSDLTDKDALMLWLTPADLTAIAKTMPVLPAAAVYVSGYLANEDYSYVPDSWSNFHVVYPYELGKKRETNLKAVGEWMMTWGIPVVNEPMQSEIYFNMLFLSDTISQLLDNFYRDYMVERAEDMLSWGSNVSPYPHLGMSRGQRYASKGAYIAKFADGGDLVAETNWIVP